MALTKIGSIGINTGIAFAGVTTIATLNGSDAVLSVGGTVNFVSDVSIGGTVSIAGTLTYEDVTNVDAVGLITARDGINVGSGITLSVDGDGFFTGVITATSYSGIDLSDVTGATGDFSIADKIVHTGDTNTAIRFPAADTITAETGGSERLRIDSSGRLLLGTTTEGREQGDDLTIATSGTTGITIRSGSSDDGNIYFSDGTSGAAEYQGVVQYNHANNELRFYTSGVQCSKFNSSGHVEPGTDSTFDLGTSSNRFRNIYGDTLYGDGSNLTGIAAGITTEAASISGITTYLDLTKDDHELVLTGTNTISVIGGAQGTSHTLRLQNSGIATVTLDSTYFKFPSGASPAFPTTSGSISLVSFTVHKAGAVGVNTVLLTGASVSFS